MKEQLTKLDELLVNLNKECTFIFKNESNINQIYKSSRYVYSISHRAIEILRAFKLLIDDSNFLVANALTRLQADNCIRLFAMSLVEHRGDFFDEVLNGSHIRNLKDGDGNKMFDSYLVAKLNEVFQEFEEKYKSANKFIHFCDLHLTFNTSEIQNPKNKQVTTYISERIEVSDDSANSYIGDMYYMTDVCYLLIRGYRLHMEAYLGSK